MTQPERRLAIVAGPPARHRVVGETIAAELGRDLRRRIR